MAMIKMREGEGLRVDTAASMPVELVHVSSRLAVGRPGEHQDPVERYVCSQTGVRSREHPSGDVALHINESDQLISSSKA